MVESGVPEAMRLRDYSSFFRPEEFDALTAAYDAAWRDLWTERLTLADDLVPVLKRNLTQIILASACNGNRDVEQLKEIALRGVSGRSRAPRASLDEQRDAGRVKAFPEMRFQV
jgi:hypothetical protein